MKSLVHIKVESSLVRLDGARTVFDIYLSADGKPELLVFWDIDKTLVDLEVVYRLIRPILWPKAVALNGIDEVSRVHLAGFKLGTMWRELYRMYGIYELGKTNWKDSAIYEAEFLAPGRPGEQIDEAGNLYHDLADHLLAQFDLVASRIVIEQYQRDPEIFISARLKPTYKLAQQYLEGGVPMVGMSANPRKFINTVCQCTGLTDFFVDCASDTDVPGLKEYKIEHLCHSLEGKGISVPYDRLLIIGDSLIGDLGSGPRFAKLMQSKDLDVKVSVKGLLVVENEVAAKEAEASIELNSELRGVDILRLS